MNFKAFFFLLVLGLLVIACDKDDDDICNTTNVTYTNTVASTFNGSCAFVGCHVDGNEMNAFFSLEGYEKSKSAANFGRIVGAISHDMEFSPMPVNVDNKLDQCSIDKIAAWIDAGAPE